MTIETDGLRPLPARHGHTVQFYESDDYLCRLVARFVADGLRCGEPALLIATEEHRHGVAAQLRAMGIDAAEVTMLDARATLDTFANGGTLDETHFRTILGGTLEQLTGGSVRTRVRAYGEMVDLLWREGNGEGALRLEEMWNGLADFYAFTLLCAYPMSSFYKESHGALFEAICRAHQHVLPAESFSSADGTPAREIALLQQRALALETEIEHRKQLEAALRQSLRAKDEFLATLSHELRTPLTAILGWARMLETGEFDAETARAAVRTIERSARTQAALIDDLLDVSRIVTGKLTLHSGVVDLADVVERAVETTTLAAEARGIDIVMSVEPRQAIVNGDATRLQQIAWNLLSNAVKFSESGSRVSIAVTRDDAHAHITVRDEGRGISPEFLPRVFEPFTQADGSSTRAFGGLGLGLAIVRHVTELHGGTVTAHSDGDGKGATFVVTLPLV